MSLEFKQSDNTVVRRYFLYLKAGKIAKSIFTKHKWLSAILLYLAYRHLKKAGINFSELAKLGAKLIQIHKRINALVVEFKQELTPEHLKWIKDFFKVDIEPVKEVTACLNVAVNQTGVSTIWKRNGFAGKGITVAVIDTGINDNHPDLKGKVIGRRDFTNSQGLTWSEWRNNMLRKLKLRHDNPTATLDPIGHGTHCAGSVGGKGTKYRGIAPQVEFVDVRVLGNRGSGTTDNIVKGMSWASEQGVDIISMSLGGPGHSNDALSREANALAKEGIVVVVAAGNSGPRNNTIGSPGTAEYVITVGSVDQANKLTSYSSRGPVKDYKGRDMNKPDILAPGGGIKRQGACAYGDGIIAVKSADTKKGACSHVDGRQIAYEAMSGTSMATPHVAGICALLLEDFKDDIPKEKRCQVIKRILKESAKGLAYKQEQQGAGLIDVVAALKLLKNQYPISTSRLVNSNE